MRPLLKFLHTSDWHLGRRLYGKPRDDESAAFLDWLVATIDEQGIDVLLVAGDIFDTTTPSNRAQELYYRFLARMAASGCRHVVIIAGNHDSPSFLEAPAGLLSALDIHVVGAVPPTPQEAVLVLKNSSGGAELIVCAVPYLRDRDVRTAQAGESIEDKALALRRGMAAYYAAVTEAAEHVQHELGGGVPIVAMGHLFAAGGQTLDGDGVRDLYVGSLAHVGAHIFPDFIDYVALGHLHVPQKVAGHEHVRYSGSPMPMGFGEAGQEKSVCVVQMLSDQPEQQTTQVDITLMPIPPFRHMEQIEGDWPTIVERLGQLAQNNVPSWVEVIYTGDAIVGDLRDQVAALVVDTPIDVLRIKDSRVTERVLRGVHEEERLDELTVEDVFDRCLETHDVPEGQHDDLKAAYREVLQTIHEADSQA